MRETMEPLTEEECTADEWDVVQKADAARQQAAEYMRELESMGANVDVADARIDHLLLSLCRIGVITKFQYATIMLDCNRNISSQMQSLVAHRRAQIAELQRLQQEAMLKAVQEKGGLITPPEKKLIVPPGTKT